MFRSSTAASSLEPSFPPATNSHLLYVATAGDQRCEGISGYGWVHCSWWVTPFFSNTVILLVVRKYLVYELRPLTSVTLLLSVAIAKSKHSYWRSLIHSTSSLSFTTTEDFLHGTSLHGFHLNVRGSCNPLEGCAWDREDVVCDMTWLKLLRFT